MNIRLFKYSVFLVIGITLSITLLLSEFDKNNNDNIILLAQEQEKSIDHIDNKKLQSSSNLNSNTGDFKKLIMSEEISDIRTTSNYNDYTYELTIHIPKGSFHPATLRSFNPDEIIINKGQTITWINEEKIPHTITSKEKDIIL
jgi:plastocyanin